MEAYLRRTGQTATADAGATARGAIAITRNSLEAANGIHIRALKQRDASLVEAAEVKSSLEAVSCRMQDQSKACSPNDQPVRKFKDGLGINMTMEKKFFPERVIFRYPYRSTSMGWGLRRVVPAATVTTHAKPHAQQQLALDLETKRAAMGQRCRPQSLGEVQRGNPQPHRWLDFLLRAALLLYSYKKSRVRACYLIPTYDTGRAA